MPLSHISSPMRRLEAASSDMGTDWGGGFFLDKGPQRAFGGLGLRRAIALEIDLEAEKPCDALDLVCPQGWRCRPKSGMF